MHDHLCASYKFAAAACCYRCIEQTTMSAVTLAQCTAHGASIRAISDPIHVCRGTGCEVTLFARQSLISIESRFPSAHIPQQRCNIVVPHPEMGYFNKQSCLVACHPIGLLQSEAHFIAGIPSTSLRRMLLRLSRLSCCFCKL